MMRNKVTAAMAGAALMVALHGGAASADIEADPALERVLAEVKSVADAKRDARTERVNGSVICNGYNWWSHLDLDGDGSFEYTFAILCHGVTGSHNFSF